MVVVLIVMGLATFMNAETRASETSETPFSLVGVGCISLALVIDAAIINIQVEEALPLIIPIAQVIGWFTRRVINIYYLQLQYLLFTR